MKEWFTLEEIAALLHIGTRHARRLIGPHRSDCHLARKRGHPRLILWVPAKVVTKMRGERAELWRETLNPEIVSSDF